MKTKVVFFTIIATSLLCGCSKSVKVVSEKVRIPVIEQPSDEVQIEKFLSRDPKAYVYYFAQTDYKFGIVSDQKSPLKPSLVYAYSDVISKNQSETKTPLIEDVVMSINGHPISSSSETKSRDKLKSRPLFGQVVSFGIGSRTKSELEESQLYIPQIVNITSPSVTTERELHPLCNANDFVLKWNEDSMNDNGVIIRIEWNGVVLFGKQREGSHVSIAKIFPDKGRAKLELEMFEGIPDTALCDLTILRGNVDAVVVDGASYKIGGASLETMSFVLLRNVISK